MKKLWSSLTDGFKKSVSAESSVDSANPKTPGRPQAYEIGSDFQESVSAESSVDSANPKTPGRPQADEIGSDFMRLVWEKPERFDKEDYFEIGYKECETTNKWKTYSGEFQQNTATLRDLKSNSKYVFRVRVVYDEEEGPYSPISAEITTASSPASRLVESLKLHDKSNVSPCKIELPLKEFEPSRNEKAKSRRFSVGKNNLKRMEKTIMLIGETGTGKTTLVDGMVNYILGVNWHDPFRLGVVQLEPVEKARIKNQAESQTEWITCYTIHPDTGSRVPYTLNIIDTPGFGDTRGIKRDGEIVEQIRELFLSEPPKGVQTIDAICFLVKAPDARLTPMQTYIFQSIMALFGKDIEDNICTLITFADGQNPPVLAALQESKLPFGKHFIFNNSGLFAQNTDIEETSLTPLFWKMGLSSFQILFDHLETLQIKSLQLTSDVLFERYRMEATIKEIDPILKAGILKLNEIKKEKEMLEEYGTHMEANKGYTIEVQLTKAVKMDLQKGVCVTNCTKCSFTCHEHCGIPKDEDKKGCWAMDENGFCRLCDGHCFWNEHHNIPYIFKPTVVTEIRTVEKIEELYKDAHGKKLSTEQIIEVKNKEVEELAETLDDMLWLIKECNQRLREIALRPSPLNMTDLIDLMIENEKSQRKDGYLRRIEELNSLRERSFIERDIQSFNQNAEILGVKVSRKKTRLQIMLRLRKFLPRNLL